MVAPFVQVGAGAAPDYFRGSALTDQLADPAAQFGVTATSLAAVLSELAALVGFVGLELAGHFVGTADPADHLFQALLNRQTATLGLA